MTHFQQQCLIGAQPQTVYAALTTTEGLRGWWTQDCEVDAAVGKDLAIGFGDTRKRLRIERLAPGLEVHWHCIEAHIAADSLRRRDEWVGTDILFHLQPEGDHQTRLVFEHRGLTPALECHAMCVDGWTHFLASLGQYAETGSGTPYVENAGAACAASRAKEPKVSANQQADGVERVERSLMIEAPRRRVWRALTDAESFGNWFGADLRGQRFVPGQRAHGAMTKEGCDHYMFDVIVEAIEPEHHFSYRWHPFAGDPAADLSREPMTLVSFTLTPLGEARTKITVIESGFERLPAQRRVSALSMNDRGWVAQLGKLAKHVEN